MYDYCSGATVALEVLNHLPAWTKIFTAIIDRLCLQSTIASSYSLYHTNVSAASLAYGNAPNIHATRNLSDWKMWYFQEEAIRLPLPDSPPISEPLAPLDNLRNSPSWCICVTWVNINIEAPSTLEDIHIDTLGPSIRIWHSRGHWILGPLSTSFWHV